MGILSLTSARSLPRRAHRAIAYGFTVTLALVIAALTLLPPMVPPPLSGGSDKVYHFIAFAGLVLPIAILRPRDLALMIPAALLFGGSIEIMQPLVHRSRELADFVAGGVGVLAGSAIGLAVYWFRVRRVR